MNTMHSVLIRSTLALAFCVESPSALAYSWTQISIPSIGPIGSAFGINDKGQVAVNSADGTKQGIYRNGIFTPLPPPPAGYGVIVSGLNNAGVVVGIALSPSDPTHDQGFILSGSNYTFFSRPGFNNTDARGIGNSGLITGYSFTDDFSAVGGFVYDPVAGTFTDVTPVGIRALTLVVAQGINIAGRVSGSAISPLPLGGYAFVWQQGTSGTSTRTTQPFLARVTLGGSTRARGINDAGFIVGFNTTPDGTTAGFVGNDARGYQSLIPPGGGGGNNVLCEGINNFRQVVCSVSDPNGVISAFIGTPEWSDVL